MKKSILLVKSLIACSILFISCNDDDNDLKCAEDVTGELTSNEINFTGKWTLKSVVSEDEIDLTDDEIDNPSTDLFAQYTDCSKDIVYEFGDNRDYAFTGGMTAIDCDNEQEITGTWGLNESSGLIIVSNCSTQLTQIEVNDESTAFSTEGNLKYVDVNGNVINTTTTFTYEKSIE